MKRNVRYRVTKPFVDADGDLHPVGEEWIFFVSAFSPQDDDLLVVVRKEDKEGEWRMRLHWTKDAQEHVIEKFSDYVTEAVK